ncbi:hypothetical protein L209DRAFT_272504 [Thermothelomyces heterothallicus CBS 203.75]
MAAPCLLWLHLYCGGILGKMAPPGCPGWARKACYVTCLKKEARVCVLCVVSLLLFPACFIPFLSFSPRSIIPFNSFIMVSLLRSL